MPLVTHTLSRARASLRPIIARLVVLVGGFTIGGCNGQTEPGEPPSHDVIWMDGYFSDWDAVHTVRHDYAPDDGDILSTVHLTNDQSHLYVLLDLREERNLQRGNDLTMWLDGHTRQSARQAIAGMGVDLTFTFGRREGVSHTGPEATRIRHGDIGLHYMPTHSSTRFEMALPRSAAIGGLPLFGDDAIRVAFTEHPDERPGPDAFITYHWIDAAAPPLEREPWREQDDDLRILTYNVFNDGLFLRSDLFGRILRAIDPDVIALLEMYDHSAEQTVALLDEIAPLSEGGSWYAYSHPGKVTASRYPIDWSEVHETDIYTYIVPPHWDAGLLVVNMHLACCDRDDERQAKADRFIARFRDAPSVPGSGLDLPTGTPMIIAGDLNLVGYADQLRTLTHGTIRDTLRHGPVYRLDWDGLPLAVADAYHLASRHLYTWRDDIDHTDEFVPGRLDYVLYTPSVLDLGNAFVLWTPDLPTSMLETLGLESDDTLLASDHLPLVTDFRRYGR